MVAAGYTMCVSFVVRRDCSAPLLSRCDRYGSSANLVLSTGNGVNGYTLDAALGEFILTHPDVRAATSPSTSISLTFWTDQDPVARKDLLLQRGQLHVLPPACCQLS